MKLSSDILILLCKTAEKAALMAGKFIKESIDADFIITKKNSGSSKASQLVTEIDIKSQTIILEILNQSCKVFDIATLTEESPDNKGRFEKDYFWCIDPLDGTLPFTEKKAGYAVSIALVSNDGTPQIGVVYDPVDRKLYSAVKGNGCFIDGIFFKIENTNNNFYTFASDRSMSGNETFSQLLSKIKNQTEIKNIKLIKSAGAAMNACYTLENNPGFYIKYPKKEDGGGSLWDFAATACIFIEAGAFASDIYGNPIELNRLESTYLNHKGILYCTNSKLHKYFKLPKSITLTECNNN